MEFEFDHGEIYENLEQIEAALLEFSRQVELGSVPTDAIHATFRHAHNLKGLLAMVQRQRCADLIHAVETNFDAVRKGKAVVNEALIQKSLAVVDIIQQGMEDNCPDSELAERVSRELREALLQPEPTAAREFEEFPLKAEERALLLDCVAKGMSAFVVEKLIKTDIPETAFRQLPIFEDLRALGALVAFAPPFEQIPQANDEAILKILFATSEPEEELDFQIFDPYHKVSVKLPEPDAAAGPEAGVRIAKQHRLRGFRSIVWSDDFERRNRVLAIFEEFGPTHVATSPRELELAFELALGRGEPYRFAFIDIDHIGQSGVCKALRALEERAGVFGFKGCHFLTETPGKPALRAVASDLGCAFCFEEPMQPHDLSEALLSVEELPRRFKSQEPRVLHGAALEAVSGYFAEPGQLELLDLLRARVKAMRLLLEQPPSKAMLNRVFGEFCAIGVLNQHFGSPDIAEFCQYIDLVLDVHLNHFDHVRPELVDFLGLMLGRFEHLIERIVARKGGGPLLDHQSLRAVLPAEFFDPAPEAERQEVSREDVNDFLESADEIMEELEPIILELSQTQSDQSILQIFRLVHNLKGDAAFVSLNTISEYVHKLENLFTRVKDGQTPVTAQVTQLLLACSDFIKEALDSLRQDYINIVTKEDVERLQAKIDALSLPEGAKPEPPPARDPYQEQMAEYRFLVEQALGRHPKADMTLRALDSMAKASAYVGNAPLVEAVAAARHLLATLSQAAFGDPEFRALLEKLLGMTTPEALAAKAEAKPQPQPDAPEKEKRTDKSSSKSDSDKTIRVSEAKVEGFYNLVGELLIARNNYEYLLGSLNATDALANAKTARHQLRSNLHLFSRLINDMQAEVAALRLMPMKRVLAKFERVVHDIAASEGKKIHLELVGAETEVDKKVAEALSEPLIHLVRNACDHGIELPQKRVQNGKDSVGRILIATRREGSNLHVTIEDDGNGMDPSALLEKAKAKGFDTSRLNMDNALDLIFEPGFSTKKTATQLSGRGVGMDIVRSTVEKLGGHVRVSSKLEVGSRFSLVVPVAIGMNKTLLVQEDGQTYALSFESILEAVKLPPSELFSLKGRKAFQHRGEVVVVARLRDLLAGNRGQARSWESGAADGQQVAHLVVLKTEKGKLAVWVDRFVKNIELALKPLPDSLGFLKKFSGVSILGDGQVVLSINCEHLA